MTDEHFAITYIIDATPQAVFDAIIDARGWWNASMEGSTANVGDRFSYDVPGIHRCKMRVAELVPNERIVWHVEENSLGFVADQTEWVGTDIVFDILSVAGGSELRFTHIGLTSQYECFGVCTEAWGNFVRGSLRQLIITGSGAPIGTPNEAHERLVEQISTGTN
jgi:uncharacterized protein YndB with AHSA1/START domain